MQVCENVWYVISVSFCGTNLLWRRTGEGVLGNKQEKEEFVIWNRFAKPQGFGAGVPVFLQDSILFLFLFSRGRYFLEE